MIFDLYLRPFIKPLLFLRRSWPCFKLIQHFDFVLNRLSCKQYLEIFEPILSEKLNYTFISVDPFDQRLFHYKLGIQFLLMLRILHFNYLFHQLVWLNSFKYTEILFFYKILFLLVLRL